MGCDAVKDKNQGNDLKSKVDAAIHEENESELNKDSNIDTPQIVEPTIQEIDLSSYFTGLNGCVVYYVPQESKYYIYNKGLAEERRSPCSTFKIISSLLGLEQGVINTEDSVRKWSKEQFWNKNWNQDIDFAGAFETSCIWYFRQVINELGPETVKEGLNKLNYGNCDISDWEGEINTNNNNPSLKGFWVESSLKISPKEQTEVLEQIFGENSIYDKTNIEKLKEVMLVQQDKCENLIYGKTGLGKENGKTIDAWFVGITEQENVDVYFAVYLGESQNPDVSSIMAKEIAVDLIADYANRE